MPSPNHHLRNGGGASSSSPHPNFHFTVSAHKLRRLNALILLRFAAFCFSLASAIFMGTNTSSSSSSSSSSSWFDSDPFRLVFAANAIVAVYSFFEMGVSIWEILKGSTLLPEPLQLWFDFGHDQFFAYLLVSAEAAGTGEAVALRRGRGDSDTCTVDNGFCVQSDISIALGFVGFFFLALSALVSAFRVASYLITGSRSHL